MPDVDVNIKVHAWGMETFRDMRDKMAEIAVQATITNLILRSMAMADDIGGGGGGSGGSGGGGGGGVGGIMGFLRAMPGPTWWAVLAAAILALSLAFAPFTLLVVAATAAVMGFVVGATAMTLVVGGAAAAFALIGAAILFLGYQSVGGTAAIDALAKAQATLKTAQEGSENALRAYQKAQLAYDLKPSEMNAFNLATALERLHDAQQKVADAQTAVNDANAAASAPLGKLDKDWENLGKTLGEAAVPAFNQIVVWMDKLLPMVETLGLSLIGWFSAKLPGALTAISGIIKDLTPDFAAFADFLGQTFDHIFGTSSVTAIFEGAVRGILAATEGIISNLVALSDWFQARLPTLGPVVQEIFGRLGDGLQGIFSGLGGIVDWAITNWDSIKKGVKEFIDGWKTVNWSDLQSDFHDLVQELKGTDWMRVAKDIGTIAGILSNMVLYAGFLVGGLAAVVLWLDQMEGLTLTGLSKILYGIWLQVMDIVNAIKLALDWLGKLGGSPSGNRTSTTAPGFQPGQTPFNPTGGRSGGHIGSITVNIAGVDPNNASATGQAVARTLRKITQS